jgi:translation initiation factor 2 beta subunit (eIF-2beta)/eIF-5
VKYLGAAAMMAVVHQRQPVTLLLAKYIHNGKMTRLFRTTIQIFKSLLLIDKIDKILAVKLLGIMYYLLFVLCRS